MNIGALDTYITIQYPALTVSSTTGERTSTWTTLASVYATVTYPTSAVQSKEAHEQGRETSSVPVEFIIWSRTDLNESMRVYYNSEYYDIRRLNKVGKRNEMIKLVTERKY
jgi:SPP1 family predicted phage head-tail adaptor